MTCLDKLTFSGGLQTKGIKKQFQENQPLITIVTVVRNGEKTLEETILSVINQAYSNIEYIIVDGASTDGTLDIIKKYEDRIDYWISEPDKGIYDAMNKGIDLAIGDWILFLGADDSLSSNISYYYKNFNDCDVVYYGHVILIPSGKKYGGKYSRYTISYRNISHQAIFYPRHLLKKYHYSLRYPICADYYLNILLFSKGIKLEYINISISYFRTGGYSSTHKDIVFYREFYKIIIKLGILPFLYSYFRYFIAQIIRIINFIFFCDLGTKRVKLIRYINRCLNNYRKLENNFFLK